MKAIRQSRPRNPNFNVEARKGQREKTKHTHTHRASTLKLGVQGRETHTGSGLKVVIGLLSAQSGLVEMCFDNKTCGTARTQSMQIHHLLVPSFKWYQATASTYERAIRQL